MIATPPLSSSPSSSASSPLFGDNTFRRSLSLPPLRASPSAHTPRFSASCASAAERERDRTDNYYYSRSYSSSGATAAVAAGAAGALAAAGGTLYDVLGLTAGASAQEIKAAYRRLARACHPDVVASERKGASADEFIRVHAAYATLSNPDKRAEYDRRVVAASTTRRRAPFRWTSAATASDSYYYSPPSPASPNPSSPSSSFRRRTWETDQCW